MTDANKPAEPSAVETPVQYDSWDEKGTPIVAAKESAAKIETPPTSEPAPTDPPKEVESEPKGKSAAETETATQQEKPKAKVARKPDAEDRISQLTAEIKDLKARLDTPKPAETKTEAKAPEAPPERPNPFEWTGTPAEFMEAQAKYDAYRDFQKEQQLRRVLAEESTKKEMDSKLAEIKTRYPDSEPAIRETTKAIMLDNGIAEGIKTLLNDSPVLLDLMYTISEPEKLGEFIKTARTNPTKAVRELIVLEGLIQEELGKQTKEQKQTTEAKEPAPPQPRAPKPPSEVGGRGTAADDALVAAARTNDFRSFEAEQTRRAQAQFKQ